VNATLRNILIIAVIALAVVALPGGGLAANGILAAISLAFLAAIAWFARRLYAENSMTLWSLTTAHRALLYGAIAVGFMTLVATGRLWESGIGQAVWFGLLALSVFAVIHVWRESRRYAI
jgi:hypothetical protein